MTTERQACGLGSFLPMSCRGRAEAFARRLQSRLQSLGRAGPGEDSNKTDDEASWLTRHSDVTSHQPRLSSSSESDLYFDFDVECESPGSPVEETPYPGTLSSCLVNKPPNNCPPKAQLPSDSGCVMPSSTLTGTSPDSDSSDGLYYDPENSDTEVSSCFHNRKRGIKYETMPEMESTYVTQTLNVQSSDSIKSPDNGIYDNQNGHAISIKEDNELANNDQTRLVKRNFRNAAGFRIASPSSTANRTIADSPEDDSKSDIEKYDNANKTTTLSSLSSDGSTTDEYFECISPKTPESLSEEINSLCLHDSGYPNTAESSRCNSQNESRILSEVTLDLSYSNIPQIRSTDLVKVNMPNEILGLHIEASMNVMSTTETSDNDPHASDLSYSQDFTKKNFEGSYEWINAKDTSGTINQTVDNSLEIHSEETDFDYSIESSNTDFLCRPNKLSVESPELELTNVTSELEVSCERKKTDVVDDDEDESTEPTPRVRRCSSLKSGKTPPGTPGRKKIVRFADVLGLDLADVRTFLDEIPKVPQSAYEDLRCGDMTDALQSSITEGIMSDVLEQSCIGISIKPDRCLIPLFQQPGGQIDFMERVREEFVCLENALITDTVSYSICGTVRVRNLDFHKSVHIRYSLDGWETFADLQATYVPNSCDGFSDKFSFTLYAHTVQVGQRLEFAVRFQCKGTQYWDGNHGANYVFQCLPPSGPSTTYMPIPISPDEHFSSFY